MKKKPLSRQEKLEKLATLEVQLEALKREMAFYYFEPNEGVITEEGRSILARYLKAEDIPQRVDSQLDVLLCQEPIVGASGGNRASKTVTATIKGIINSTGELPFSLESYREHFKAVIERAQKKIVMGRVTAVDSKQLNRVVLPAWQFWIPRQYLKNGSWADSYSKEYDILTLYREGKVCSRVEFLTNAQETESSQGGDLDWASFDEEPDKDKYKETLMRFGTADRLDITIAWTPTKGLTWATDLFHKGIVDGDEVDSGRKLFKLTTVNNRFVKPQTITKIMDEYAEVSTYDEMKMRLLGAAISLSGLVYGNLFHPRIHVIPPFETRCTCGAHSEHDTNCPVAKYFVRVGCDPHLVTPTAAVFVGVDREGNYYLFNSYCPVRSTDTDEIKADIHAMAKDGGYRWGQTIVDKSANSDIEVLGGLNVYKELSTGKNALKGVMTSEKHDGSIKAGVDEIKKLLKVNEKTGKPKFFIFNTKNNRKVIESFQTLERDTYKNEEKKGEKDRINEGKHHLHAALRYCFQFRFNWVPIITKVPEPVEECYI